MRRVAAAVLGVLLSAALWAETLPVRGQLDPRIRTASYHADQVYKLQGFVGYAIELIFEEGEQFSGTGGGDLEGVTVDSHGSSVLLKPRAAIVATNLVVFTDRRAYRFDYTVLARRPERSDELMYAVRFSYPPPPKIDGEDPRVRMERELATAAAARPRNADYWYCGHASLRPVAASDDGVQTRITFSDRSEIPALFIGNEDGTESLLNFSMDAGDVVIHRLAPRLILRRGRLTGCIVNKGFAGAGQRLESGTVSPLVERDVKGAPP
ncbi:MAG: TrbG/VirB9 family P-type conjugative transfer protein [Gammaproteobacteria bacterium]|nr:MAG: TrbG/VirB9 family P-type conjugative transfer protein [Gammaproteobacteria bacterium]